MKWIVSNYLIWFRTLNSSSTFKYVFVFILCTANAWLSAPSRISALSIKCPSRLSVPGALNWITFLHQRRRLFEFTGKKTLLEKCILFERNNRFKLYLKMSVFFHYLKMQKSVTAHEKISESTWKSVKGFKRATRFPSNDCLYPAGFLWFI